MYYFFFGPLAASLHTTATSSMLLVVLLLHEPQAALATLQRISASLGYGSVGDLVAGNMDYLVDAVCGRLRYMDASDVTTTAAVVKCIAAHAYDASVPLIKVRTLPARVVSCRVVSCLRPWHTWHTHVCCLSLHPIHTTRVLLPVCGVPGHCRRDHSEP